HFELRANGLGNVLHARPFELLANTKHLGVRHDNTRFPTKVVSWSSWGMCLQPSRYSLDLYYTIPRHYFIPSFGFSASFACPCIATWANVRSAMGLAGEVAERSRY